MIAMLGNFPEKGGSMRERRVRKSLKRHKLLLIVRINVVSPPGLLSPKYRKVFDSKEKAEKRSDA